MGHWFRAALIAALGISGSVGAAKADILFSVSGVRVSTGGALAGSFTTNDARTSVVSFDITVPSAAAFGSFDYTTLNSTVSASVLPSEFFRLNTRDGQQELQFYFDPVLSNTGGKLQAPGSYENQRSGGNRFLTGAVTLAQTPVSSVPEPASLLLIAGGLAACLGLRRGRVEAR